MSQAPIWPVATDALIGDTTHLSDAEIGSYILLLIAQWRNNGDPLPDDDKRLARMARCSMRAWRNGRREILAELFDVKDGFWSQKRVSKDWLRVAEKIAINRENASRGGYAKSLKNKDTDLADATNPAERNSPVRSSEKLPTHEPDILPNGNIIGATSAPPPKKRGSQIAKTWEPDGENIAHAIGKGFDLIGIERLAEQFRNHHTAKGTVSKDWNASWRTWVGKDIDFHGPPQSRGRDKPGTPSFAELASEVAGLANGDCAGGV